MTESAYDPEDESDAEAYDAARDEAQDEVQDEVENYDSEYSDEGESVVPDLGPSLEEVTRYEETMRSIQLLEATHSFPCNIMVKVIGRSEDGFLGRVVAALRLCQQLEEDPSYRSRETPNGLHVAVTFEPYVETAEEVLVIYDHIRTVRGVVMVM